MLRLEDVCGWIDGFVERSSTSVRFGTIPDEAARFLRLAPRLTEIRSGAPVPSHSAEFVLCLGAKVPESEDRLLAHFAGLLAPLAPGGILLLIVAAEDEPACGRLERLLAHVGSISIVTDFTLSVPKWRGWLAQRTSPALCLPMPGLWDFAPGEEMMRAVNGDANAMAHITRVQLDGHTLAAPFHTVLDHVRGEVDFECTGWSLMQSGPYRACFLAGLVRRDDSDGTGTRRVSAAGTSWVEAGFLLLCEAIERHTQLGLPADGAPGTAFGLSRDGAMLRALLENLERFHFNRIFFGKIPPVALDIGEDDFLSGLVGGLEAAGRRIELFLLNDDAPFHVVLAVHTFTADGRTGRFACGLGCDFSVAVAARKSIFEALKTDIYIDSNNAEKDTLIGASKESTQQKIAFWSDVRNWQYTNFLREGARRTLDDRYVGSNSDGEKLVSLLDWCEVRHIDVAAQSPLVPQHEEGAWVSQVTCSGLGSDLIREGSSVGKVPSPLF